MPLTPDGTAYDFTERAGRPVVVLIHGLGLTRQIWSAHIDDYAPHFSVLSYDLCGHGETILPEKSVDLRLLSDQLLALLDYLNIDKAALIGFSLGGMINRRFALDHGDRLSALVILNAPHKRAPQAQLLVEQRALDSSTGGPAATIEATLERWFTPVFRAQNPHVVAWVRQTVLANDLGNYAAHRYVLAAGVKELINPQPAITAPVLVMTCAHDSGSTPQMSHAIAAEISGAEAIIVPDLQHLGILEQPSLFIEPSCAFLRRVLTR